MFHVWIDMLDVVGAATSYHMVLQLCCMMYDTKYVICVCELSNIIINVLTVKYEIRQTLEIQKSTRHTHTQYTTHNNNDNQ